MYTYLNVYIDFGMCKTQIILVLEGFGQLFGKTSDVALTLPLLAGWANYLGIFCTKISRANPIVP